MPASKAKPGKPKPKSGRRPPKGRPFEKGHEKVGGREKGTPNKFSIRAAMKAFISDEGKIVIEALRKGVNSEPPFSKGYVDAALKYGLGNPAGDYFPEDEDSKKATGLQIVLTRPLGTDPVAERRGLPPPVPMEAKRPSILAGAAAITRVPGKPRPQLRSDVIEADGETFMVDKEN